MSDEKLTEIIQGIITASGASSMKDMGKVMGLTNQEVSGKADGKTISGIVKKLLS